MLIGARVDACVQVNGIRMACTLYITLVCLFLKKTIEYDQEIPQSHTSDHINYTNLELYFCSKPVNVYPYEITWKL